MSIVNIPLDNVRPDPGQPRKFFNKEELENLAANIAEHGVLEPIIVRPNGSPEDFVIIAGERRWRASQMAGLDSIPSIVRSDMSAEKIEEVAISENTSRTNLNPVEEARAFERLLKRTDPASRNRSATLAEIGRKVGKSPRYVEEHLSILTLDEDVVRLVEVGQMNATTAIQIARLPKTHRHLALRAVAAGTVDSTLRVFVDDILNRLAQIDMFMEPEVVEKRSRDAQALRKRVDEALDTSIAAMSSLVDRQTRTLLIGAYTPAEFEVIHDKLMLLSREANRLRAIVAAAWHQTERATDDDLREASDEVPA